MGANMAKSDLQPSFHPYSYTFSIEKDFKNDWGREWLRSNKHLPVIFIAIYVIFIVYLFPRIMKERRPFKLKPILFLWNVGLAAFSTFGAWRSLSEFSRTLQGNGFHHAICVDDKEDGPHAFWSFAFVVSKLIELGDTVFIAFRKTDLIFLHWWHHVTVIIFGWWSAVGDNLSLGRWIMTMNFSVHSLMYSYYTFRSVGIRIWKPLAMSITLLQILQMFVGIFVVSYAAITQFVLGNNGCQTDTSSLVIGFICYGSYFVLFLKFFIKLYFGRRIQEGGLKETIVTTTSNTTNATATATILPSTKEVDRNDNISWHEEQRQHLKMKKVE